MSTTMQEQGPCPVDEDLERLRMLARPGALPCLRYTAELHLALRRLARGDPGAPRDGFALTDEEIAGEYWRLSVLHPNGPACGKLEPGMGTCGEGVPYPGEARSDGRDDRV